MKLYYISNRYPEERCIINKVPEEKYIPLASATGVRSLKAVIERLQHAFAHRYSKAKGEKTLSCYWLVKREGMVHTFNSCVSGKNSWCVTFESILPRTNYTRAGMPESRSMDKMTLRYFRLLAKENCKACLALSQATYKLQMSALDRIRSYLSETEIDTIRKKTIVLHPPQNVMITKEGILKKFQNIERLELMFVGHDFFRKGGKEIVDCLMTLKERYLFHLTVVSSLEYGDYASHATKEEMIQYKELLMKEEWISYYETLPNEKVIELCKKAHVGLLPTFADTYGYSVLEMQACGCGVVTTNVRALPEINNESCGWIVKLPKKESGEADYMTDEKRKELKNILARGLKEVFEEIFSSDKKIIQEKACLSLERIEKEHDPQNYANMLNAIYKK